MLILFLNGIYEGVKTGVTGYVKNSPAEIWICQKNSTNLIRSSSFLSSTLQDSLYKFNDVKKAEGILRAMITCEINKKNISLLMIGLQSDADLSLPKVYRGKPLPGVNEIVLDKPFALKYNLQINDSLKIQGVYYRIVGISVETNAAVVNFCFLNMKNAYDLIGFQGISSFYLITSIPGKDDSLLNILKSKFYNLNIYSKKEFIQNHIEEIKTGFLPVLWTIAFLGFSAGIVLITLMFYSTILERREDYALLKALGMSFRKIMMLILPQTIIVSVCGYLFGVIFYLIFSPILMYYVPEINLQLIPAFLILLLFASIIFGCAGSIISIREVYHIYPAEVFRA